MHEQHSPVSDDANYLALAESLFGLQENCNDGRGVDCIRTAVTYLRLGNVSTAEAAIRNEWDKISSYPEVAGQIIAAGLFTPLDISMPFENDI